MLDVLLDGVNETRLKLISEDEARALMILLAVLDDHTQTEDIRRGRRRDAVQARLPTGLVPALPRRSLVRDVRSRPGDTRTPAAVRLPDALLNADPLPACQLLSASHGSEGRRRSYGEALAALQTLRKTTGQRTQPCVGSYSSDRRSNIGLPQCKPAGVSSRCLSGLDRWVSAGQA